MISSFVLMLSVIIFIFSTVDLFRKPPSAAPVTFVFLGFLHAFVGLGYLFLSIYQHWEIGERYESWADVELTETTFLYVLFLCLTLLVLSNIRLHSGVARNAVPSSRLRPFSAYEFSVAILLVSAYLMGIKFGTFRFEPGATSVVLPFRLNGILEIVMQFLLPAYISLSMQRLRRGFWYGLAIMGAYGAINLTSSGSKSSAIYPLLVFLSVAFLSGRLTMARLLAPALLVMSIYTVINPWFFSAAISDRTEKTSLELLRESAQTVQLDSVGISPLEHGLMSLRNFSHRMTGLIPMQYAINLSAPLWQSISACEPVTDVIEYYNEKVVYTRQGSTNATGHFAFFMFMFRNHILGFSVGWLLLVVLFYVGLRIERKAAISGAPQQYLFGLTYILMIIPFLLDGDYDNVSGYLHLVGALLAVRFLFYPLFAKQTSEDTGRAQLLTSHEERHDAALSSTHITGKIQP